MIEEDEKAATEADQALGYDIGGQSHKGIINPHGQGKKKGQDMYIINDPLG